MRIDGWEDYLEGRERMDLNTKAQPREESGFLVDQEGLLTAWLFHSFDIAKQ
jgi:hypothetical protein